MKNLFLLIILIVSISSCIDQNKNEQYDYYHLTRQITPNERYYLYDYARYGAMAFSSDISGTELFNMNQSFNEGEGIRIPGIIGGWISKDTLLVYDFKSNLEQPQDTLPIKIEYQKIKDIVLKIENYKLNSAGRSPFKFDSLSICTNSIKIFGIGKNKLNKIFRLGSVVARGKGDTLSRIDIAVLEKDMDFVRMDKYGNNLTNQPGVGMNHFEFTPNTKINLESISNIGLYKAIN